MAPGATAAGEVFAMTWQGGGGYGDPLTRDLREDKITAAAVGVYGVVLNDGAVDRAATAAERDRQRTRRRDRSDLPAASLGTTALTGARRLDDNLVEPAEGGLACGERLVPADHPDTLATLGHRTTASVG